jgi:hypothetical protein
VQPYRTYTPALIANLQHRYEWTPEPVVSIAADAGIHPTSLHRMAKSRGWKRHNLLPPRDLPPALKILEATRALEASPDAAAEAMHDAAPPHNDLAAIERLEQGVLKELATVEALRARLSGEPQRPIDAERTARTLSLLTQTLQHLQRMRAGQMLAAQPTATDHHHDDDLPADIDAFRLDLARRIDAFVQSELDAQDADARSGPAPLAQVR